MFQESVLGRAYAPALPTLWPQMLFTRHSRPSGDLPFASERAHYFYFARNAVWLAARMFGLDRGEVLVPAYHHGVEIEALVDAGAEVRFYRVGDRWDVDVEDVRRKISSRTRALYLTHYAGFPGPTAQMRALADAHGLPLIEDCALSLLSRDGDEPLGSQGDVSIFCLYKTLPVPNGGALVENRVTGLLEPKRETPPWKSTASHAVSSLLQNLELRGGDFGRRARNLVRNWKRGALGAGGPELVATGTRHFNREHLLLGMSSLTQRIVEAQAFPDIVRRRRENYIYLLNHLTAAGARPLFSELAPGVCPLFFPMRVKNKSALLGRLHERGIEAIDFWRHHHPACDERAFPEVDELRRTILEIPCHQDLSPERIAEVARVVEEVWRREEG